METKGPWEWVGFRKVALRGVREGWMETKGAWEWVGFRKVALRGVREGWMETKGPCDGVGFREGFGKTLCWGNVETNLSMRAGGFHNMAWED